MDRIISASPDKTVRLWDLTTSDQLQTISLGDWVRCASFSPDGSRVVAGCNDGNVYILDARTLDTIHVLKGHSNVVESARFSSDGLRVVSGSWDKSIRIWDAESGTELLCIRDAHDSDINCVCFDPDDRRVVSGSDDKSVRVWDAMTGERLRVLEGHNDDVFDVQFSPDGDRIASGSFDNTVRIWNGSDFSLLYTLQCDFLVWSLCFHPCGSYVASGGDEGRIQLWNCETGDRVRVVPEDAGIARSYDGSNPGMGMSTGNMALVAELERCNELLKSELVEQESRLTSEIRELKILHATQIRELELHVETQQEELKREVQLRTEATSERDRLEQTLYHTQLAASLNSKGGGFIPKVRRLRVSAKLTFFLQLEYKDLNLVEEVKASGGQASVVLASHPFLTRFGVQTCAKVFVSVGQAFSEKELKRIRRDIQLCSRLWSSSRVVPILAWAHKQDTLTRSEVCLLMEYCPNGDLKQFIEGTSEDASMPSRASCSGRELFQIALDLATGLKDVHEKNVIHGDVKPSNFVLDSQMRAKVVDFGLAVSSDGSLSSVASTKAASGTPAYQSLELLKRFGDPRKADDIYALGVCLFELACGSSAYPAEAAPFQILTRKLEDKGMCKVTRAELIGRLPERLREFERQVVELYKIATFLMSKYSNEEECSAAVAVDKLGALLQEMGPAEVCVFILYLGHNTYQDRSRQRREESLVCYCRAVDV